MDPEPFDANALSPVSVGTGGNRDEPVLHGPWTIVRSETRYADPWIDLRVDQVIRPDGLPGTYSTVRLRPGVCVIALDEALNVHLTREFHYAVGRVTLEGVSGGIEDQEDGRSAALRELQEELGISAQYWEMMGTVDPFTSAILSPVQLFVARGLSFHEPATEGTEQIEGVQIPLAQAIDWIDQAIVTHAPTCVLLLKLARRYLRAE
jgi:ADP-ribose pyrophosphatase